MSLLVIGPPVVNGAAPVSESRVVAGLPLRRRITLAARRAGFHEIVRAGDGAGTRRAHRVVVVPANVVPQVRWLRALREMPLAREQLRLDASGVAVVETERPERLVAAAARCRRAGELARALGEMYEASEGALDPAGRFVIESERDVPRAERWLLGSLVKPSEGFMSRHVERRISLALTRRLVRTRMTPNVMTVVSVAVGLAGAPFFLSSAPAWQLVGALLFLAHSILDGCDGELARLKFMESPAGAVLDFWGDNLVHVAVFGSMALGWSLARGAVWPLLVGVVAVASTVATASLLAHRFTGMAPAGSVGLGARLADTLAHRDFIYLIVVLAAFGRAAWFLALTAVGGPLFLLALVCLGGARRRG